MKRTSVLLRLTAAEVAAVEKVRSEIEKFFRCTDPMATVSRSRAVRAVFNVGLSEKPRVTNSLTKERF